MKTPYFNKILVIFYLLVLSNLSILQCQCGIINSEDHITQFGITWYFDKEYDKGQFANGDWWVVGPVTILAITPVSTESGGRAMNGSMVNPSPANGLRQGYDSACEFLTYAAGLNAALNASPAKPLILQNGSSLVSTISIAEAGSLPQLQSAAVLTVLAGPPAEGSFRPSYSGIDKSIRFNEDQLDYSLLLKLTPVTNTPDLATVERYFERPWIDHIPGWGARETHPLENMPDYGREIATRIGTGALMLHLNFSDEEKRTLLVRYIQLGIDLYGIVQNGGERNWGADGGHASGRKWPILFAGLMLNDAGMKNIGQKSGNYLLSGSYGPGNEPSDYIHFGEDDQTFYVSIDDVTRTTSPSWNPDVRGGTPEPYSSPGDIGLAEWGIGHAIDPYQDNRAWSATYRQCCTGLSWPGFVLAARIMGAQTLWNHPALFDYQDRYMAVTADASSTPAWRTSISAYINSIWGSVPGWRAWDTLSEEMWDTYRNSY